MKVIRKKYFCKVLDLTREYWKNGDHLTLTKRLNAAEKAGDWYALVNFAESMLHWNGIAPEATNDELCDLVRSFGWEVTDDGEEHPAN